MWTAVESYLHKSKNGLLGVTGEGSLLENAIGLYSLHCKYSNDIIVLLLEEVVEQILVEDYYK